MIGPISANRRRGGTPTPTPTPSYANLLVAPDDLSNAAWTKTGSLVITPDATPGPGGVGYGDKVDGSGTLYQPAMSAWAIGDAIGFQVAMRADTPKSVLLGFEGYANSLNNGLAGLTCNVTTAWQVFTLDRTILGADSGMYAEVSLDGPIYLTSAICAKGALA